MNEREREVQEFDKAHEGQDGFVRTKDNVWFLYSDGCRRGVTCWGEAGYERVTPPADTKEATKWIKHFWELKLAELVDRFEDLRGRCQQLAKSDGALFAKRLAELKALETKVRSARTKLSRIVTAEKGYTQRDVDRAWETWNEFSQACSEESHARAKYENALLGKSSPGVLEKLKFRYDQAKQVSQRMMERWNGFTPAEARSIVSLELDERRRAERESELSKIEV